MVDYSRIGKRQKAPLTLEQKVGMAIFLICGLGGLALGIMYMGQHLSGPFNLDYTGPRYISLEEQQQIEIDQQKERDLDADGLNDYDELYVYGTSPYIADSDSDGFDDKTEIESGNDPLCPEGDVCGPSTAEVQGSGPAVSDDLLAEFGVDKDMVAADVTTPEGLMEYMKSMSADQIRDYLINQGGVDPALLEQVSDEELVDMFDLALKQSVGTETTEQ